MIMYCIQLWGEQRIIPRDNHQNPKEHDVQSSTMSKLLLKELKELNDYVVKESNRSCVKQINLTYITDQ